MEREVQKDDRGNIVKKIQEAWVRDGSEGVQRFSGKQRNSQRIEISGKFLSRLLILKRDRGGRGGDSQEMLRWQPTLLGARTVGKSGP